MRDAAIPIPTHIKDSGSKKAHITSIAKGNKNCVIAKSKVFIPALPPVTEVTNLNNKKNCITPVTTPIITAMMFSSTK